MKKIKERPYNGDLPDVAQPPAPDDGAAAAGREPGDVFYTPKMASINEFQARIGSPFAAHAFRALQMVNAAENELDVLAELLPLDAQDIITGDRVNPAGDKLAFNYGIAFQDLQRALIAVIGRFLLYTGLDETAYRIATTGKRIPAADASRNVAPTGEGLKHRPKGGRR